MSAFFRLLEAVFERNRRGAHFLRQLLAVSGVRFITFTWLAPAFIR